MPEEEAKQMADDFYKGTDHSGFNPNRQSFERGYADSKNNKRRNGLRKILEKQAPGVKK
jgi:hypothetical protein